MKHVGDYMASPSKEKKLDLPPNLICEDVKEQNKFNSKFEHDLYHDEDNVILKIIRVKRFFSSSKEEWKVFEDANILLVIEGNKCTRKEKLFLRTVEGVNWIISQYKSGINSFNSIKKALKLKLNS
jgi:hypothetical protein